MHEMDEVLQIMSRLRDPLGGCPWDRAQSYATIVPHTLEEAYEVADAIARDDPEALRDELGDLLFQVIFYCQLASEEGAFDFRGVAAGLAEKLVRRHPHVFGDVHYADAEVQTAAWEAIKAQERGGESTSALDGVPRGLPALTRALKLQRRAARVGFDWGDADPVLAKVREELDELQVEMRQGEARERLAAELGDLLFACVNLARHLAVDPEGALRAGNEKFERRFRQIETWLAEADRLPSQASLAEMDALWERAKAKENSDGDPGADPDVPPRRR